MKKNRKQKPRGFSLVELLIAMTISLVLLALAGGLFARALGVRSRESSRTDALTSAQAALNVMSREVSNSGYGLTDPSDPTGTLHYNGIVLSDSKNNRLRIRANVVNNNLTLDDAGEDITYYFDAATESVVRHDPRQSPKTSYIINRVSDVAFAYFDYQGSSSATAASTTPTRNTGRIRITVVVKLDPVQGQPSNQTVTLTSDVTLRNSGYMLNQY